jgi:hypothetical protein
VRTARTVRLVSWGLGNRLGRIAVQVQSVLSPVFGPFLFDFLRYGHRGDSEPSKREDSGANADAVSTKTFGRHDSAAFWAARTWRQAWTSGPALLKHPVDACAQLNQPRERHRFIPLGAQHFDHFRKPNPITISCWQVIQSSLADLYLDRSSGKIITVLVLLGFRNQKSASRNRSRSISLIPTSGELGSGKRYGSDVTHPLNPRSAVFPRCR